MGETIQVILTEWIGRLEDSISKTNEEIEKLKWGNLIKKIRSILGRLGNQPVCLEEIQTDCFRKDIIDNMSQDLPSINENYLLALWIPLARLKCKNCLNSGCERRNQEIIPKKKVLGFRHNE